MANMPDVSSPTVVVFDGGIPESEKKRLSDWVKCIDGNGVGTEVAEGLAHGLAVTSSVLFGALALGQSVEAPSCKVLHVRVVGGEDDDLLTCTKILRRISHFMATEGQNYRFFNCSIGPCRACDDDDVTEWTATFDEFCADGTKLVTVAAGNDGEKPPQDDRIQPPADGVNILSVGASHLSDGTPKRARYSSRGPDRCPGVIKPDGVAFGGDSNKGFGVLGNGLELVETWGTSFAAPFALRAAAGIHYQVGGQLCAVAGLNDLSPLVIRALLNHRSRPPEIGKRKPKPNWKGDAEVGWGHFETEPTKLITCADDEAFIIYQGDLPVKQYLRANVPMPDRLVSTDITLVATLVIATEIDPQNAGNDTRNGLEVTFRPDASSAVAGKHAKSEAFFPAKYVMPEFQLRVEGKWETCRRQGNRFSPGELNNPYFHLYYHHRGMTNLSPIPYALVVSVKAHGDTKFNNDLQAKYRGVLEHLQPQATLPVPVFQQ